MFARRRIEHRLQSWKNRDRNISAGLLLLDAQHAIADMLAAHEDDVAAPLRGVEPERQREPGFGPDRIEGFVLRDLLLSPCVVPVALLDLLQLDAERRVGADSLCSTQNVIRERIALSQLRAACGFMVSSTRAMYSCGSDARGMSP